MLWLLQIAIKYYLQLRYCFLRHTHAISDCDKNFVENTVADINSAAVKTKLLELLEKHLRLEDSFYAKFLIDSGSAFDIIDRNFWNLLKRNPNSTRAKKKHHNNCNTTINIDYNHFCNEIANRWDCFYCKFAEYSENKKMNHFPEIKETFEKTII